MIKTGLWNQILTRDLQTQFNLLLNRGEKATGHPFILDSRCSEQSAVWCQMFLLNEISSGRRKSILTCHLILP